MSDDIHHDLYAILSNCWDLLERGARHRESRLHSPVLATTRQGCEPDARTVALQWVDAPARRLYVNTHRLSPKFRELQNRPRALFLFFDGETQLRLRTDVLLHCGDAVADRSWAALPVSQRLHYQSGTPPGTPLFHGHPPSAHDTDDGKGNYVVIEAHVTQVDWLNIAPPAPRRALFTWNDDNDLMARWVAP